MESDLLEISEEDSDSLLLQHQQIQTDAVSTFDSSLFSCSPLHFPISNPADVKQKTTSISSNINKENISNTESKSELPKLSLEPQTMKRKKKGGGYNLRKSLAWNRAFFTEEGVLNSTELSLISGNFSNLSGEKLLSIEEEPGESLSGDAPDLQELENNLFKELPLNDSNTKEAKKTGISSLRQKSSGSASRSTVKQNVLSVHDVNRSGSKRSGCPRPAVSSALKRPANLSTTKTAVKEPKISKIPAPKAESSTARSSPNLNKPKRNQGAQAAVSAHRIIGVAGSNKTTRSTKNDAKSTLSSRSQNPKSSTTQLKRNVKSSALSIHSSAQSQHPLVTKADNVLKVNQDPVVASGQGSINHGAGSNRIASIPRSVVQIGGNTQYVQPQMAKPSGLRMPSPSLGFFTQSKANASNNIQSSTTECNNPKPNIPKLRKLGAQNSTLEISTPSIKVHVMADDVAATENARVSSTKPSLPSSASSLCEDVRPNTRMAMRVPCNPYNHELTNNQQQLHTIDSYLKQKSEDVGFQCTDNKLLLHSQLSEEVNLDCKREDLVIHRSPDHIAGEIIHHHGMQVESALKADNAGNQLSGNKENNSSTEDFDLLPQLHSCDVNSSSIHGSPMVNNDQVSIHDRHEHSNKQAELAKPCTFENDQVSNEIERPHINDGALLKEGEPSEEFLNYISVHGKGICPNIRDLHASEVERTNGLSHYGGRNQGNDGDVRAYDLNQQSLVADAQKHSFECKLSLETSSGLLNASQVDNQHKLVNEVNEKLVERPPLPDPCILLDTIFQDNYGSHSTEELLVESNLQHVKDVACHRELSDSSGPCGIPPSLKNCVQEMDEVVECQHVKNEAITGAITACDIGVNNDCQSNGDLDVRDMDDSHSISPLGLVDDTIDLKKVEGSPCYFSTIRNSAISEPGVKIISCHFDASAIVTNSLMAKQSDCETITQDVMIQSLESGTTFQENQIPEACHGVFSVEGESQNFESEMGEVVECQHVENEASVSTDTQCDHDMELHCEANSSKGLERISEDQVTGAIIACDIGVSNDCQSSGDLDVTEMDYSHSISPLGQVDDTIDLKKAEGSPDYFSTNCDSAISDPGVTMISCHFDASAMLTNSLMGKQSDCETVAQDVLIQSSFEAGNTFQENQIPEACNGLFSADGHIFAESENFESEMDEVVECRRVENEASVSTDMQCDHGIELICEDTSSKGLMAKQSDFETIAQDELIQSSFEAGNTFQDNQIPEACRGPFSLEGNILVDSQNFHSDNCADIGPRDKSSVFRAVESPDLSQVQTDKLNDKCAAGDTEATNGSSGRDACFLSFNGGSSFDSCKTNLFTSAENNNSAVVENLDKPHELQNVVNVVPEPGKFGLPVTAETSSFVEIKHSDNNHDGCNDMIRPDNEQSGQVTALNVELSLLSEDEVCGTGNTSKSQTFCALTEESTSSINTTQISSNGSFLQEDVNQLENDVPQESNISMIPVEAKGSTSLVEETGSNNKQIAPVVKPPLNAVPFSDEWLAAFEAAGEEILTMKSGAVQNSPKDKSLPEPGPWSPVKKNKNQTIGPFDCTKCTSTNIAPDYE